MWLYLGVLIHFLCWEHCSSDRFILSAVTSFASLNKVSSIAAFVCQQKDAALFYKTLSDEGIPMSVFLPGQTLSESLLLKTECYRLAVIVDVACDGSVQFMAEASKKKHFSSLHHWLLLPISEEPSAPNNNALSSESLMRALEPLDLVLDSHVTLAIPEPDQVLLQDVYRLVSGQNLTVTSPRHWSPGQVWPTGPRRDNYGGVQIKTAVIVVGDPWEHFFDMRYKHLNTLSKNNYALMAYVSEMLNFRMNLTMSETWGFPVNETNNYTGIVGLMQRGEVEIGAAGLLIKETRMDMVDYAGEIVTFRGAFMFLKPSLSEVSIIYYLPFSKTVWITFTLIVVILTVGQELSNRLHRNVNKSESNEPTEWSEAILNSIGIVCEQGLSSPPENVSSRIVFLCLLMLSVFVLTSYSAIIVSLLQTSSDSIDTLTDLMDSAFHLSMEDISYNTNYVNDTIDPVIQRLFKEKLYAQPYKQAFTTQKVGVEKIRTGLNAFHGDAGAYKVMSDTFEEYDKCRLKEIKMYSTDKLAFPVRKGSPYREHITQRARWLREIGLVGREYKRWFYQKPKCDSNSQGFVSVRILDFYPVLFILLFGIICAIGIFVAEVLYNSVGGVRWWSRIRCSLRHVSEQKYLR
ncbi:hypothetical protein L798_10080 [Zootermopsis nevadensis]|uniref:Uncharacterized protein n=1 Tax=Zootermopsis nevadensis TaxID=136037 RepID=A0A067R040_ZOONE|nr:hypothetical protein L798_10080 [Zootermopsis nevadensis]